MPTSPTIPGPIAPPNVDATHPSQRLRRNLLVLWHLLSLDAPTVATVWTLFIASAAHLHLPDRVPVAMFAAVWVLYAADRLLDSRILASARWSPRLTEPPQPTLEALGPEALGLEARHFFHHQHRRPIIAGILLAALLLAALVPQLDPASIRLDLVLGSLLFAYFVLIHATASAHRLPKEISVGLFFAAAVFIPTISRAPQLRLSLLPIAALFAVLCSLNCLFIYRWEHAPDRYSASLPEPLWLTRTTLGHLPTIAATLAAASLAVAVATHQSTTVPIALSAVLLLGLDHNRNRLAPLTLRAAADLVLLTPLPLLLLRHAG